MKIKLTALKNRSSHFYHKGIIFFKAHWPKIYGLLILLLLSIVIWQQFVIANLQWRVDYMNDYNHKDSYSHRVFQLEIIQKALNSDVYQLKKEVAKLTEDNLYLKMEINELRWKLLKSTW